jgi:tRNA modification GTPase
MAKINPSDDTVAAVITPAGAGAVGIVRLSGPEAIRIADRIFLAKNGRTLASQKNFTLCYGHVVRGGVPGEIVDEVLVSVMRAPRSYTREDIVEISCHGGSRVLGNILELVLENGARLAEPGEFTKRAFLNGRIDLAQAEAVLDVIQAKSERALKNSLHQLSGAVSRSAASLRASCLELLGGMEAAINFPDDAARPDDTGGFLEKIRSLIFRIESLLSHSFEGRIIREGLKAVIYGRPNVGKSSLLNALLKEDRAIVTPFPGTTRDTIEEFVSIKGLAVRLVDTAGILEHRDAIEEEALARARRAVEESDLVLFVLDGSSALTEQDRAMAENLGGKKTLVVINKCDLKIKFDLGQARQWLDAPAVEVCSLDGKNIARLEELIFESVFDKDGASDEGVLVSNRRHIDVFSRARESLKKAEDSLKQGLSLEFVAMDASRAAEALGELTGEVLAEDVLDVIFSKFCIGK